jgi:tungstate transport system substrate-binding protein
METSNKPTWMDNLERAVPIPRPKMVSNLCRTILKPPTALIYLLLILMVFQISAGEKFDGVYGEGREKLIIATGSPGELGLLKELSEAFSEQEKATVYWKKAGSGQSLKLLKEKKVDVIMVHAPAAEKEAVEAGWATQRTLIGSNEFFVVGPMDDPADIASAKTVVEAYGKIAARKATFFSRGDNSGTHKKEMAIWEKVGIKPEGTWYIITRDFMSATLRRANAEKGYFMTDSSTWYAEMRNLGNLKVLFRGDRFIINTYHALCQPAGATSGASLGARFITFVASEKGQGIIRNYGKRTHGEALYNDAAYAKQFE